MKCRPGDIVRYARTPEGDTRSRGFIGMVSTAAAVNADGLWTLDPPLQHDWLIFRIHLLAAHDDLLEPIRPADGVDEMLRIAGKPLETPADLVRQLTGEPA